MNCYSCGQEVRYDYDTKRKFDLNESPHKCSSLIPLYTNEATEIQKLVIDGKVQWKRRKIKLSFDVRRSEASIALAITDEAIRVGIDPFRAHSRRKGDYLEVCG